MAETSEEDSFVIFGSTPTPSMDQYMGSIASSNRSAATSVPPQRTGEANGSLSSNRAPSMLSKNPSLEIEQPFSMLSTNESEGAVGNTAGLPPVGDFLLGESSGYSVNASLNPFHVKTSLTKEPSRNSPILYEPIYDDFGRDPSLKLVSAQSNGEMVSSHGGPNNYSIDSKKVSLYFKTILSFS